MVSDIDGEVVRRIRELNKVDTVAAAFFDWASKRERDAKETLIGRLASKLGIRYEQATALGNQLRDAGSCRFILGRRGGKSRLAWSYSLRSLGKVAKGETYQLGDIEETSADDTVDDSSFPEETANGELRHSYALRPNMMIKLVLPSDLTEREAERLATFINSLPFGG